MFRRRRRDGTGTQDEAGTQSWPADEAGTGDEAEFEDEAEFDDEAGFEDEAEFDDDEAQNDDESGAVRSGAGPSQAGSWEGTGPWDGAGSYPDRERIDFGSILVPAREGMDVQINVADEQNVWITVLNGDSALQLQAYAAPKTSGLWREVRQEFAQEVAKSGGQSTEADGPFGTELHATVNAAGSEGEAPQPQQLRFLGVDGPRWFLRGMISGPAAAQPEVAAPFEELFADVVVVRGDHPAVPRELLEIQLPEEARKALEEQMAAEAQPTGQYPNPFERGPEITEIR